MTRLEPPTPPANQPAWDAPWAETAAFVRALTGHRQLALRVMLFTSLLALTEWVGLFLLVPLLAVVGLSDSAGPASRMAAAAEGALTQVGVQPTLPAMLAVFVLLVTARASVQRAETNATSALENEFVLALRTRSYRALLHARWAFLAQQRSADFLHVLTTEATRVGTAAYQVLRLLVHLTLAGVYLLLALRLSIAMTLIAGLTGIMLLLGLRRSNARALAAGEQVSQAGSELHAVAQEHIAGAKTARCYGAEERNAAAFANQARELADASRQAELNFATSAAMLSIGSAVLLGAFVYTAVELVELPTTAVLLLLLIFSRVMPRVSDAQASLQQFLSALPAYSRMMALITSSEAAAEVRATTAAAPLASSPAIRVRNATYRYPGSAHDALTDVDFEVPSHRMVAIVGASGAGKSTVADLLLGILSPDAGSVEIDGRELSPENHQAWRERIGFVPQETFLLHDTVRANLRWAAPEASDADILSALRSAAAMDFVERLPRGLDTTIGDRGVLLSGGERQRLALARALLRKPGILILDEATSALDSVNEQRIHEAIASVHGTVSIVIITHRLSAVRDADMIVVLDRGTVVQSGTWDALVQDRRGHFRALCLAQRIIDPDDAAW